jgi:hypothetical protein
LDNNGVRDWNGYGYDAVVLAAQTIDDIPVQDVYCDIGANNIPDEANWEDFLATTDNLETARKLLSESVLCFVKSLRTQNQDQMNGLLESVQGSNQESDQDWKAAMEKLLGTTQINIPKSAKTIDTCKICIFSHN